MSLRPAALFSLTVGALLLAGCGHPTESDPRLVDPVVDIATVRPDLSATQTFTGVVAARVQSDLGFRVSGKVIQRLVDVGQRVHKGQPLMRIDPIDLNLAITNQKGVVASAKAKLVQAQADEARLRSLVAAGAISAMTYDQAVSALNSAKAQLDAAQAQENVASNASQYAELKADVDGLVVNTSAEPGQVVAAGQTVVQLAEDGAREAAVELPETLRPALESVAQATLYGRDGKTASARLRELSEAANPITRTYAARYVLSEALKDAPLGATVNVTLQAQSGGDKTAFTIPLGALRNGGEKYSVWVVDHASMTVQERAVDVRNLGVETATVTGELNTGETVVALGAHLLHANQKVRLGNELAVTP
ncbi:efflux RND transporter periplasmic adaptor subunit [Pseudomonas sp. NPDC088444]|uniref:efflux RND transporter periplasmic adaptor subunit n=1 Tax=Pseudomonas sp. NPDC088444 TaxID=3364456 RepID=UPI00384C0E77